MRKVLLLIGLSFCVITVYAQKFEAIVLDEIGDEYEVRIKNFEKVFKDAFTEEEWAQPDSLKSGSRSAWRKACAERLLTPELKAKLREVAMKVGGGFWVRLYVDETGKPITVTIQMSATVYVNMPTKLLREIFNLAMQEKLDPANYVFEAGDTYAVDAIELMSRAVEDLKKE